jgi:ATP synthase protein I
MNGRDEDGKLDDLGKRLKAARARRDDGRTSKRRNRIGDFGPAIRVGVDLVSGVVVGVVIGLVLDRWLGTAPWLMLVFFILGSAAGIMNVMRTARRMESDRAAQAGTRPPDDGQATS